MANIPATTPLANVGATVVAPVTLAASNTLTFSPTTKQVLFVRNASASSVTLTLDGADAPASVKVEGTGATFNTATGASIAVAAGAIVAIPLANYRAYLIGAVTQAVTSVGAETSRVIEV